MNNMDAVRKLLKTEDGQTVEMGEDFNLKISDGGFVYKGAATPAKYVFNEVGLYLERGGALGLLEVADTLMDIIRGNLAIVKLPFRLKYDEFFYFPLINAENELKVCQRVWTANIDDFAMLKAGWVFRTKEECEKALPRIKAEIEKMKGEKK